MNPPLELLINAFKQFQLVYVAIKAGVVTTLASGPKSLDSLAMELRIPALRLRRLLRGLVWSDVLACDADGLFSLTEDGKRLIDQSPASLAAAFGFHGDFFYSAWGKLFDWLEEGAIPFEKANGSRVFDLMAGDKAVAASFSRAMSMHTSEYSKEIAEVISLQNGQTLVDIGSGEGQLVIDLLGFNPSCRGIVFDLAMLQVDAEALMRRSLVADRCVFTPGNMFHTIPAEGDVYIMKWLLHDWDDENVLKILDATARAMRRTARLFIIERLFPLDPKEAPALVQADLNMLCLNGGTERTLDEYSWLISAAGLRIDKVLPFKNQYGFLAIQVSKASGIQEP